jgi:hypothetical protein
MGCRPLEMVGRDDPGAVGLGLDARAGAAQGFEPAHMRLGEGGMGGPVMLEVDVDAVPIAMGGGDFHHSVVGLLRLRRLRLDGDDAADGWGSASALPIST